MHPKSLEEITRRPYPLKGVETKIFFIVTFTLVCGFVFSLCLEDWAVLEKTGCIIVIIGVVITWRDVKSHIEDARIITKQKIKQYNLNDDVINTDELFNIIRKRILAFEAITLILGTFLWGFGGSVGNLLWQFNISGTT